MPNLADRYVDELHAQTKYFATWFPNTRLKLGDYGSLDGKHFTRLGSLRDFGVTWKKPITGRPTDFDHTSGSDTSIDVNVGAKGDVTAAAANGGVAVQLGSKGAWVFQAAQCTVTEFVDARAVGAQLLELYESKLWDSSLVFIDFIVTAKRTTIMVSASTNASIELGAKGTLPPGAPPLAAEVSLQITAQKGSVTKFLAEQGLTPLFGLSRVKPHLLEMLGFGASVVKRAALKPGTKRAGDVARGKQPLTEKIDLGGATPRPSRLRR